MKKITKILFVCCLVVVAALGAFACGTDNKTKSVTPKSVEGFSSSAVTIDAATKSLTINANYSTQTFSTSAIKFEVAVTVKAYSDEARKNELTTITLAEGKNTFYLVLSSGSVSENWTLIINRAAPSADVVASIEVKSFATFYTIGEEFAGGKITATYETGTTIDVDITLEMLTGFSTATSGQKTVTITYEGVSTTVTINVVSDEPTEIDIEDVREEIGDILIVMYFVIMGEAVEREDMLELMFDGDQELMDTAFELIHSFIQESGFTVLETASLAALAQSVQETYLDIMTAIANFDGSASMFSAELVGDIFELVDDITEIMHPVRVYNLFSMLASAMESEGGSYENPNLNFDNAILEAEAQGLTEVKAGLIKQKAMVDFTRSIYSMDSIFGLVSDKQAFIAEVDAGYRVLSVLTSRDPGEVVRVIDYIVDVLLNVSFPGSEIDKEPPVKPYADTDPAPPTEEAFELDIPETAFVLNFIGEFILDIEALGLNFNSELVELMILSAFDFAELDIDIASIMTSSLVFSGNLLKNITEEDIQNIYDEASALYAEVEEEEPDLVDNIAALTIYGARLIEKTLAAMSPTEIINFYKDVSSILGLTFDSFPNVKEAFEALLAVASYDPENLSEAELEEVLSLAELLGDFEPKPEYYTNLNNEYIMVEKGTTLTNFRSSLSNYYLEIYSSEGFTDIDLTKATITGFDSATTGPKTITLTVKFEGKDFKISTKCYIYDETSVEEFVLVALNSSLDSITQYYEVGADSTDESLYVWYDLYFYNTEYDFVINAYKSSYVESEIIGFDSSEASAELKTGFVKIWITGAIGYYYLPVQYGIYDQDNPIITEITYENYNLFLVGEQMQFYGSVQVSYNFGLYEIVGIDVTSDMIDGFDTSTAGSFEYTVTVIVEGETYVIKQPYTVLTEAEAFEIDYMNINRFSFYQGQVVDMDELGFYVNFRHYSYDGVYTIAELNAASIEHGIAQTVTVSGIIDTTEVGDYYLTIVVEVGSRVYKMSSYYFVVSLDEIIDAYYDGWPIGTGYQSLPSKADILELIGNETVSMYNSHGKFIRLTLNQIIDSNKFNVYVEYKDGEATLVFEGFEFNMGGNTAMINGTIYLSEQKDK